MSSDSFFHIATLFLNIKACGWIRNRIGTQIVATQKITYKLYLQFVKYFILLIMLNQVFLFLFEKPNIYEQLQCPRSYSLSQVKAYGDELKVKLMKDQYLPLEVRISKFSHIQNQINILSHPARRLSYDSFGHAQTEYAWAFKSTEFLLQIVIQSAVFYLFYTVMSLVNTNKQFIKDALKVQIFVMILLFIWEIDIIMGTEKRLHQHNPDFLDYFYDLLNYAYGFLRQNLGLTAKVYFAFPMFQRREAIKSFLIPAMNMVQIFIVFFIKNEGYKKIVQLGTNPKLKMIQNQTATQLQDLNFQNANFQQILKTRLDSKVDFKSQVFKLNRQIVINLFKLNQNSIVPTPQIMRIKAYFKIK